MTHKRWTEEEIETLEKLYPLHSASEIAQILKRSKISVQDKIAKLGLHKISEERRLIYQAMPWRARIGKHKERLWKPEDDEKLTEMYKGGTSVEEIAKTLHRTVSAVRDRVLRLGLFRVIDNINRLGLEGEKLAESYFAAKGWKLVQRGKWIDPYDFIVSMNHGTFAVNVKHSASKVEPGFMVSLASLKNLMKLPFNPAILYIHGNAFYWIELKVTVEEMRME
jgi:hypothetical protein